MANRFLTRDEVVLEIGIPMLRAVITAAQAKFENSNETTAVVPNAIRDCMPIMIERSDLENGGAAEMLSGIDLIEAELRKRMNV